MGFTRETRLENVKDHLALPPVGWGSPRVTQDTLLDRWHQLNGTWNQDHSGAEGEGQPREGDSAFHSLADLEASGEPADLLTTSPEVEPSRQYTDPAFCNRPTSRTVILRPTRRAREKPRAQTVLVPWIYAPVFYQSRPSSTGWAGQTPVSGGTGLRVTTGCPPTSTGWYDELSRGVEGQSRRSSPTHDWPELRGGETSSRRVPTKRFSRRRTAVYRNQVHLPTETRVFCVGRGIYELGNVTWTSHASQTEDGVTLVISED